MTTFMIRKISDVLYTSLLFKIEDSILSRYLPIVAKEKRLLNKNIQETIELKNLLIIINKYLIL